MNLVFTFKNTSMTYVVVLGDFTAMNFGTGGYFESVPHIKDSIKRWMKPP